MSQVSLKYYILYVNSDAPKVDSFGFCAKLQSSHEVARKTKFSYLNFNSSYAVEVSS